MCVSVLMFINSDEGIEDPMTPDERQNVLLTALEKEGLDRRIFLEKENATGRNHEKYLHTNHDLLYTKYL